MYVDEEGGDVGDVCLGDVGGGEESAWLPSEGDALFDTLLALGIERIVLGIAVWGLFHFPCT